MVNMETWCYNALFSIQKVLVLPHWYCFTICEYGNIFLKMGHICQLHQSASCFQQ